MAHPLMSHNKIRALSFALFLIGMAALIFFDSWWPGIMLVLGLPLAIREYLQGRIYDTVVTLFVFVGIYISVQFEVRWKVLLPVLLTLSGIFIFFREFFATEQTEEEKEEDLAKELEEESEKNHNKKV